MEVVVPVAGVVVAGFGVILLVVAVVVSIGRRDDPAVEYSTDRTTTADDATEGPIALRGTVIAAEQGALRDPLEGRPVVWWHLEVVGGSATARTGARKRILHEESHRVDFVLIDGSERPARVDVSEVRGYVTRHRVYGDGRILAGGDGVPWTYHQLSDEMRQVLRERSGSKSRQQLGANLSSVAVGETVTVSGWMRRFESRPIVGGRAPNHELMIYGVTHEELADDRADRARNRVGLAVVGVVLIALGCLAIWWGAG